METSMPMKIVYLLSQFPTANHTYLLREVIGLKNLGWDVKLISVRRPDRPAASLSTEEIAAAASAFYVLRTGYSGLLVNGVIACLLNPRRALRGMWAVFRHARSVFDFFSFLVYLLESAIICREIADDDQHVHGHFCMQLLVLLNAMRGPNWSATIHGPAEFDGGRSHLLSAVVSQSSFIRTISSYGRAQCLYRSPSSQPDKIFVNRLGVTDEWLSRMLVRRSPHSPKLITVGRLSFEKGQRYLLEAFGKLAAHFSDSSLTIIGDGPDRAALEIHARDAGISHRVIFTGWRNPREVREALEQSDLFVSTSFAEGIPVVLMEAMAVGVTCIATPVGGVSDLIEHGLSGLLVQPADVPSLTEALRSLLEDDELRWNLAREARARIDADFCLDINVSALSEQFVRRIPTRASHSA